MKNFSDYKSWLLGQIDELGKGKIYKLGIVRDRSALCFSQKNRDEGLVMAPREGGFAKPGTLPDGLIFVDGSFLRFRERIVIKKDGSIEWVFYNYHYQRPDDYFFRYDKLPQPHDNPIKEPQQHLHAVREEPRFPTHSTNLVELLDLIKCNFYC